jgi:hypothetical protein
MHRYAPRTLYVRPKCCLCLHACQNAAIVEMGSEPAVSDGQSESQHLLHDEHAV